MEEAILVNPPGKGVKRRKEITLLGPQAQFYMQLLEKVDQQYEQVANINVMSLDPRPCIDLAHINKYVGYGSMNTAGSYQGKALEVGLDKVYAEVKQVAVELNGDPKNDIFPVKMTIDRILGSMTF